VSQWWAGNLFVVASGLYLGAAALGALRLSQSLLGVLNVLLQSFENYVLPQSARKMNIDMNMGVSYLKEMNKKLAFVFIPVLALLFVMASPILMLTGGTEYIEYTYVLQGLCILYVFILLSQPIRFMIRALHLNQYFFTGYLISLAYAIITSHGLISSFGLVGVVAGLIGAQIILIVYWLFILQSKKQDLWKSFISF
jgi:O-antigen/teichoic acid export membrane protein